MKKYVVMGSLLISGLASVLALGFVACGSDGGSNIDGGGSTIDAPVISGTYTHYVTSEVKVGANGPMATQYATDVDGNGVKENKLGQLLATFNAQIGLEATLNGALARGEFVLLHSVKAAALTSSPASWQVYLGNSFNDSQQDAGMFPDLSGSGTFTVDTVNSPTDAKLIGSIDAAGKYTGGPGHVSLEIAITAGAPIRIDLQNARIEGTVTATGCTTAKIGGGVLHSALVADVFPVIAADLDALLDTNNCRIAPSPLPTCGSPAVPPCCTTLQMVLLGLVDVNMDRMITAADLENPNGLVGQSTSPDLDLTAANGPTGPNESISIGLGFSCVGATFTAPGE